MTDADSTALDRPDEKAADPLAPRVLVLANQKGGVGKTTTAINLGTALAAVGERVLIVDMDPQGNASTGLGVPRAMRKSTIYDVVVGGGAIANCAIETAVPGLFIVPADEDLSGIDRLRVIVNAMTRMRVCTPDGRMALDYKGEPGETHGAMIPWFDMPGRKSADHTMVVGHWSALGLLERSDVLALDTGCVWGRTLSAVRFEDRKVFQRACSA